MAPVPRRPPPTPLIVRPTLVAPSTPVPVTSFIPRKLFLQLFAGTVCIFIVTVLFWKFPGVIRFFTKDKVLREGNATTARYVKTWYGWVPTERHESNKRALRNLMAKLSNLSPWRSSKVDFQWVWWEHGEHKLTPFRDRGKEQSPRWMRGYGFVTADTIWNFESVPRRVTGTAKQAEPPLFPCAVGALLPPNSPRPVGTTDSRAVRTSLSLQEAFGSTFPARYAIGHRLERTEFSFGFGSNTDFFGAPYTNKRLKLLRRLPHDRGPSHFTMAPALNHLSLPQSFSTPCLSQQGCFSPKQGMRPHNAYTSDIAGGDNILSGPLLTFQRSRKYQVWSARMGLLTLKCIGFSTHTLPQCPPGTPESALLGSFSVGTYVGTQIQNHNRKITGAYSSDISELYLGSGEHQNDMRGSQPENIHDLENDVPNRHSMTSINVSSNLSVPPLFQLHNENPATGAIKSASPRQTPGKARKKHCMGQAKDWSNWEVRLLDNLNRRLEWLSDQLNPGKRTFHFALLANHWLNTETWIVYDPISRVPIDARRRLGDPRFNVPYPSPQWNPHPKYPKTYHRLAHTPKINAWRAAMNRNRRASGLKKLIKSIELYDSSAEDPPDGRVDPASWIIRKPPQGISLSSRQMETYYEGGAGWQEKLIDWQKIRRGYRIQKAIHEGRVNRTRVKEIVSSMSRYYQRAAARFFRVEADGED
ncbi:hypothetical protein BJX64DRAFT_107438 [Aspergillus heterothallicus]